MNQTDTMEIGSADWNRLIIEGALRLGVTLPQESFDGFHRHARELLIWNRRMNLTRIVDPVDLAVRHIVDSLSLVPYIPFNARVVDIGSGGGFPGIPVKLARRDIRLTLVESIGKKTNFLRHLLRILGLGEIDIIQARAESAIDNSHLKERFDVVMCRALASLWDCFVLSIPFLTPHGKLLALKSSRVGEEIKFLKENLLKDKKLILPDDKRQITTEVHSYVLPMVDGERMVVEIVLNPD